MRQPGRALTLWYDESDLMVAAARRALDSWAPYADRRQPLDISAEMMRLTLEVVGQALFSVDLSAEASALGQSFTELLGYLNYRLNHLFSWPLWAPTPRHRRMRRALRLHTMQGRAWRQDG